MASIVEPTYIALHIVCMVDMQALALVGMTHV